MRHQTVSLDFLGSRATIATLILNVRIDRRQSVHRALAAASETVTIAGT